MSLVKSLNDRELSDDTKLKLIKIKITMIDMFIVKVMVKKIFYQGSMPRSGSTLFQNIMAQNPDFYATPTSGLCEALINLKINVWNAIEFKAQSLAANEP